jgi:hypothetical protein
MTVVADRKESPTGGTDPDQDRARIIARLREIIHALDSRVPHLEREGEMRIVEEAKSLRDAAVARIAALEADTRR